MKENNLKNKLDENIEKVDNKNMKNNRFKKDEYTTVNKTDREFNEVNETVVEDTKANKKKESLSYLAWIAAGVVIALLLNTFVIMNIFIPSESMETTLMVHDRLIVSRLSYINNDPERYDIIVFHSNFDKSRLIKRVIGLPGETINIKEGIVYITDNSGKTFKADDSFVSKEEPVKSENLGPYVVPQGSYFVMGDNRNHSFDSRYWENHFVNKEDIMGKPKLRYFPFNKICTIETP